MSRNVPRARGNSKWISLHRNKIVYESFGHKQIYLRKIPEVASVYILYFEYGNLYVGSTVNLRKRIGHHLCSNFKNGWKLHELLGIKYQVCKKHGYWMMLEARLIKRLQPTLNIRNYKKRGEKNGD